MGLTAAFKGLTQRLQFQSDLLRYLVIFLVSRKILETQLNIIKWLYLTEVYQFMLFSDIIFYCNSHKEHTHIHGVGKMHFFCVIKALGCEGFK